jgi:periplasmic protein TonB
LKIRKTRPDSVPSLDELVYRHRDKEFGGYYLRMTYTRRLIGSFLIVAGAFIVIALLTLFAETQPDRMRLKGYDPFFTRTLPYEPNLVQTLNLPPPGKLSGQPSASAAQEERLQNSTRNLSRAQISNKPLPTVLLPDDSVRKKLASVLLKRHQEQVKQTMAQTSDSLIMILDRLPEFPGGNKGLQTYFRINERYPKGALRKGIQGITVISFMVSEKGIIDKTRVVAGLDPELDMEALRLIRSMPPWKPAEYNGKPVKSLVVLPVTFSLR